MYLIFYVTDGIFKLLLTKSHCEVQRSDALNKAVSNLMGTSDWNTKLSEVYKSL
jgi:hypothetical protein